MVTRYLYCLKLQNGCIMIILVITWFVLCLIALPIYYFPFKCTNKIERFVAKYYVLTNYLIFLNLQYNSIKITRKLPKMLVWCKFHGKHNIDYLVCVIVNDIKEKWAELKKYNLIWFYHYFSFTLTNRN